jgi:hypothetical protein
VGDDDNRSGAERLQNGRQVQLKYRCHLFGSPGLATRTSNTEGRSRLPIASGVAKFGVAATTPGLAFTTDNG